MADRSSQQNTYNNNNYLYIFYIHTQTTTHLHTQCNWMRHMINCKHFFGPHFMICFLYFFDPLFFLSTNFFYSIYCWLNWIWNRSKYNYIIFFSRFVHKRNEICTYTVTWMYTRLKSGNEILISLQFAHKLVIFLDIYVFFSRFSFFSSRVHFYSSWLY